MELQEGGEFSRDAVRLFRSELKGEQYQTEVGSRGDGLFLFVDDSILPIPSSDFRH